MTPKSRARELDPNGERAGIRPHLCKAPGLVFWAVLILRMDITFMSPLARVTAEQAHLGASPSDAGASLAAPLELNDTADPHSPVGICWHITRWIQSMEREWSIVTRQTFSRAYLGEKALMHRQRCVQESCWSQLISRHDWVFLEPSYGAGFLTSISQPLKPGKLSLTFDALKSCEVWGKREGKEEKEIHLFGACSLQSCCEA